jgi:hypothetical protein
MKSLILALTFVCAASVLAQTSSPQVSSGPAQDPAALQTVQQAITAMALSPEALHFRSFVLTGTMETADSTVSTAVKAVARGANDFRFEAVHPDGSTQVFLTRSDGRNSFRDRSGKLRAVRKNSTIGTDVALLPLPGLLSDLLGSAATISALADDHVNGRLVRHVAITRKFAANMDPDGRIALQSRVDLYIDAETFLVLKIAHTASDLSGRYGSGRTLTFSDYRNVDSARVPFSIAENSDGNDVATIELLSIDFKAQISDRDFDR